MSISIRNASPEDSAFVADLAYKTFFDAFADHPKNAPADLAAYMAEAFSEEQIKAELAASDNIFIVAEVDGEAAGYARMIIGATETDITTERPIELNRLYIHQRFLGKGVGQKLMDECFAIGRNRGHDVMWLGVWEYNPRAQRFYEKNGFRFVGSHIFQVGSDPQTDLLMQLEL